MTTLTTNAPLPTSAAPRAKSESRFDASVNREEMQFVLLALLIIGLWAGATAIFGYAGLIIGALTMVATMYAVLITISRG